MPAIQTLLIQLDENRRGGAFDCLDNGELVVYDVWSGDIFTTDGKVYPDTPVYNVACSGSKIFGSGYLDDGQTISVIDVSTGNKETQNAFDYSLYLFWV